MAYFILNHTIFGRSVYAVGGNPISAWLSGINVKNVLFLVLVISGLLGALAGLVIMSRTMVAGMLTGRGLELDAIAAVLIGGVSLAGGRGNLIGVVIGALIIGVINNGMNIIAVGPAYDDLVKGGIILAAVAVDVRRRRR
ncbi:Ribose import permease protein RbsC [subsurface metagenome]